MFNLNRSSSCRPLPPPRPPDRKPPPSPQDQGYHTLPPWPGGNGIRTKLNHITAALDIDTDPITYDSSSDCNQFYYRDFDNHFDVLPDDLIIKVLSWLSSEDLAKMAMTCRRFAVLCWSPMLWECISLRCANDKMLKQIFHILCKSSFSKINNKANQSRFLDHHMRYIQPIHGCPYSDRNDRCQYGASSYCAGRSHNDTLSEGDSRVCLEVSRVMLSENCAVTDRGLSLIANKCPELTHLQVSNSRDLCTDLGVDDVVSACENLRHLDLTGCHKITRIQSPIVYVRTENSSGQNPSISHRVTPVLRTLLLQYLDLSDCISLDDNGLHITVKSCVMLTFLYLRRCTKITGTLLYILILIEV